MSPSLFFVLDKEGEIYDHGIKMLSIGPIILFDIMEQPETGRLLSLEYFSVIPNSEVDLQIWHRKGSDDVDSTKLELIISTSIPIKHKGLNSVDLSDHHIVMKRNDVLALSFKDQIIPLPVKEVGEFGRSLEESQLNEVDSQPRSLAQLSIEGDASGDLEPQTDLFVRNEENINVKCTSFLAFSQMLSVEDQYLCDISEIISDDAVFECLRLAEDCKDGIIQSQPNSCLKLFTFNGCIETKITHSNLNCDANTLNLLKSNLKTYGSAQLTDGVSFDDCYIDYGFNLVPNIQKYPEDPYNYDLLGNIIEKKCYFVPISQFNTINQKCSYSYTIMECTNYHLIEMGYEYVDLRQLWNTFKELSQINPGFVLNDGNFETSKCGTIEDVLAHNNNFVIDTCSDLRLINNTFVNICSKIIQEDQSCTGYDQMIKCMLSAIYDQDHQSICDRNAIDHLINENKLYFISNYGGFDPSICTEKAKKVDETCFVDNIISIASKNCFDHMNSNQEFSVKTICDGIFNMIYCVSEQIDCKVGDILSATMHHRSYLKEIMNVDPIVCELPDEIENSIQEITEIKYDDKNCEMSPLIWFSKSKLSKNGLDLSYQEYLDNIANEKESLSTILSVCSYLVPNMSIKIQQYMEANFGFFCPYEKLRDRLFDIYTFHPYIEYSKSWCDNVVFLIGNVDQEQNSRVSLSEVHIDTSGCLMYAKKSEENNNDCKNVEKFFECMRNYTINFLNIEHDDPISLSQLSLEIIANHHDYLLNQFEGNSLKCFKVYPNELHFQRGHLSDENSCPSYFKESEIINSGCLEFLQENDTNCVGIDDFLSCFTNKMLSLGLKCPRDNLGDILAETQASFLYFNSSAEQQQCLEFLIKKDDCLTIYPIEMIKKSQCLPIIQSNSQSCREWELFIDCFTSYYQKYEGKCEFESIRYSIFDEQLDDIKYLASPSLSKCFDNYDQENKCIHSIDKFFIEESGCIKIMNQDEILDCRQVDTFFTCVTDYARNYTIDCDQTFIQNFKEGQYNVLLKDFFHPKLYSCPNLNIDEKNCYDEYSIEVMKSSSCLPILAYKANECQLFNIFTECLSNYLNKDSFTCSEENITNAIAQNQSQTIIDLSNGYLEGCFEPIQSASEVDNVESIEWNYSETEQSNNNDFDDYEDDSLNSEEEASKINITENCQKFLNEKSINSSSCKVLLNHPKGSCDKIKEFGECIFNENAKRIAMEPEVECKFETFQEMLYDRHLSLLEYLAGDALKNNCFNIECDQLKKDQIFDMGLKVFEFQKFSCSDIMERFANYMIRKAPSCSSKDLETYLTTKKSRQLDYMASKRGCQNYEKCQDPQNISSLLYRQCNTLLNSNTDDTCELFSLAIRCIMDGLMDPSGEFKCDQENSTKLIYSNILIFEDALNRKFDKTCFEK